ncbi:MAG: hypothetical protein EA344_03900 [Alkalicoccus sp.]|nr:MAG: hypothetical protein EA344_03900 [Alkalicoccus sp.]
MVNHAREKQTLPLIINGRRSGNRRTTVEEGRMTGRGSCRPPPRQDCLEGSSSNQTGTLTKLLKKGGYR